MSDPTRAADPSRGPAAAVAVYTAGPKPRGVRGVSVSQCRDAALRLLARRPLRDEWSSKQDPRSQCKEDWTGPDGHVGLCPIWGVCRDPSARLLSFPGQPGAEDRLGDGAQPRGWALLAAHRVACKRTRAWKRNVDGRGYPCRWVRAAAASRRGPGQLHLPGGAEDRTSPRASLSLTEVRAAELPEPAECLRAPDPAGVRKRSQARRLAGSAPATPTAAVADLAGAARLARNESSRAPCQGRSKTRPSTPVEN